MVPWIGAIFFWRNGAVSADTPTAPTLRGPLGLQHNGGTMIAFFRLDLKRLLRRCGCATSPLQFGIVEPQSSRHLTDGVDVADLDSSLPPGHLGRIPVSRMRLPTFLPLRQVSNRLRTSCRVGFFVVAPTKAVRAALMRRPRPIWYSYVRRCPRTQ